MCSKTATGAPIQLPLLESLDLDCQKVKFVSQTGPVLNKGPQTPRQGDFLRSGVQGPHNTVTSYNTYNRIVHRSSIVSMELFRESMNFNTS